MRSAVISSINFLINRYLLRMSRVLSPPTFLTDSFNTTTVLSTNVNQRKKITSQQYQSLATDIWETE